MKEYLRVLRNPSSKDILIVIAINCFLAVVSFGKDVYMAAYLGTSANADVFLLSYFIVDTLGSNLLAVALGVAVIPILSVVFIRETKAQQNATIAGILCYTVLTGLLISALLYINRYAIYTYLGSGFSAEMQAQGVRLLTILTPILTVFPVISLGMAVLQVNNRFAISTAGPVVLNALLLMGLIFLYQRGIVLDKGVYWLSFFLCFAVLGQFIFIWFFVIRRCRVFPDFTRINDSKQNLLPILKNFLPYFLVLSSTQIIFTVERYLATGLGSGTLSALNYAFRLVQFPIWVFVAAVATVAFPEITKKALDDDKDSFSQSVYKYVFITALFTAPLTIILYILRYPIIKTLFERGEFNAYSVEITAAILSGYVFCIVWQGISALLIRVSMLKGSKSIPLKAAFISMTINLFLVWQMVGAFGSVGIGYAAAFGNFFNALVLYLLLRKQLTGVFGYMKSIVPFFGANAVLLITCLLLKDTWFIVENGSEIIKFGFLGMIGFVCIATYILSYLGLNRAQSKSTYS